MACFWYCESHCAKEQQTIVALPKDIALLMFFMPTRYLTNKLLQDVDLGKNLGVSE